MRLKIALIFCFAVAGGVTAILQSRPRAQTQSRPRTVAGSKETNSRGSADTLGSLTEPVELKSELAEYPNPRVSFICGPQLKVNSRLNPFPWFDTTQVRYGHVVGRESPVIAPRVLTGTVSVMSNSRTVNGIGTRFRSEIDPKGAFPFYNGWLRIKDAATYRELKVESVQSDTQLTLTANWKFAPVTNAQADTYHYDATQQTWNYDHYFRSAYYDTALVEYINSYRTGDAAFLSYARKMADALWASQYIDHGTVVQGSNHLP